MTSDLYPTVPPRAFELEDLLFTPYAKDAPLASSTTGAIVFVLPTASLTNSEDSTPGTTHNSTFFSLSKQHGSEKQQAKYAPVVECPSLQSHHPLSAMENLLVQRSSKCTPLDPTGAYCLVARDADLEAHPKNITPSRPPTPGGTLHPAVIRVRPIIALPPFYARSLEVRKRQI
jgi:hypothetical protein